MVAPRAYSETMLRRRPAPVDLAAVDRAVAALELPRAVWKTCPWEPEDLIAEGLRQWLRCDGAALREDVVIGMPSRAVDEAWHGFILCTARYAACCDAAYGRFVHHHPEGGAPETAAASPVEEQLSRTVIAWSLAALAGAACVLRDLDARVGVEQPWGIAPGHVAAVEAHTAAR